MCKAVAKVVSNIGGFLRDPMGALVPKMPKMPGLDALTAAQSQTPIADTSAAEAYAAATIEARQRRRRAGVAADILTGPSGIPAAGTVTTTAKLGGGA